MRFRSSSCLPSRSDSSVAWAMRAMAAPVELTSCSSLSRCSWRASTHRSVHSLACTAAWRRAGQPLFIASRARHRTDRFNVCAVACVLMGSLRSSGLIRMASLRQFELSDAVKKQRGRGRTVYWAVAASQRRLRGELRRLMLAPLRRPSVFPRELPPGEGPPAANRRQ
jgi:hypothetical protein